MKLHDRFPHITALAQGTISGRFSEWPKLQPEARAILAAMDELERRVSELSYKAESEYARGFEEAWTR